MSTLKVSAIQDASGGNTANTDYANFKREIEAGTAELQDADGQPMSAADANAFVATLP